MLETPAPIALLRRLARRADSTRYEPRDELASIAEGLDAMIAGGDFALCFAHVRQDVVSLAAKLRQLAEG